MYESVKIYGNVIEVFKETIEYDRIK